ncbi:MAG: TolC family protein [Planctomycetota bacterium]
MGGVADEGLVESGSSLEPVVRLAGPILLAGQLEAPEKDPLKLPQPVDSKSADGIKMPEPMRPVDEEKKANPGEDLDLQSERLSDYLGNDSKEPSLGDKTEDETDTAETSFSSGSSSLSLRTLPSEITLTLADVIASVYRFYPDVVAASEQYNLADGELLAAWGNFDHKMKAKSLHQPLGNFLNYRNSISIARDTWWGGSVEAGYKIGRGVYAPWYLERQTEDAGEVSLSIRQSLLRGLAIDVNRVEVFRSTIARRATTPLLREVILINSRDAAELYWKWIGKGIEVAIFEELLDVAMRRNRQLEIDVEIGKTAEVNLVLNRQLIASRRTAVLAARRSQLQAAVKLSLFVRDPSGEPIVPPTQWVGPFPDAIDQIDVPIEENYAVAISQRPELEQLELLIQDLGVQQQLARNNLMPEVDLLSAISQDIGEQATSSNNKDIFALFVGIEAETPIQRRKAFGKLRSNRAKIAQTQQKLRLQRNKIIAEIQTQRNDLELARLIVEQSEEAYLVSVDVLKRYEVAYEQGSIDLNILNLLESKAFENRVKLAKARQDWFVALVRLQYAIGFDPLQRAIDLQLSCGGAIIGMPPAGDGIPNSINLPELFEPYSIESDAEAMGSAAILKSDTEEIPAGVVE